MARDSSFYSNLKRLNEDLVSFMKSSQEKSPYLDFTPTVQDYAKQVEELLKSYPETQSPAQTTSLSAPTFGTPIAAPAPPAAITSAAPTFMFGTSFLQPTTTTATTPAAAPTTTLSSFSAAAAAAATTSPFSSTSFFSFTMPQPTITTTNPPTITSTTSAASTTKDEQNGADDQNGGAAAADDEDSAPPEPKIDKYEEPDSNYSARCKLYEKSKSNDGEVNVNILGVGNLYVKSLDAPNKLQLIIRQEPDLRKVLLNEVINPSIPVKLLPKAVQLAFPSAGGKTKFYIAKLRDEKDANTLYEMLNFSKV